MLHREMGDVDDRWTLGPAEHALLANKSGITRLGFAVLLKMFQVEGRFPRRIEEVPTAAVEAIARQLGLLAIIWPSYDWNGRTIAYHRAQIRRALGFREALKWEAEVGPDCLTEGFGREPVASSPHLSVRPDSPPQASQPPT